MLVRDVSTSGLKGFFSGRTAATRQVATLEIRLPGEGALDTLGKAMRRSGDFEIEKIEYGISTSDSPKAAVHGILIAKAIAREASSPSFRSPLAAIKAHRLRPRRMRIRRVRPLASTARWSRL